MEVTKVISGGQVGADIAALRAAQQLGIATGGYAPKGWRTKDGSNPALALLGLKEHTSPLYPPRTKTNVRTSDATVRLAHNFSSPGEKCTLRAIREFQRPYFDVRILYEAGVWIIKLDPAHVREFLTKHNVHTLNVAGNADPTIERLVERFLTRVLRPRD